MTALAEIVCVSPEIKELILKRFKHDRKFNQDMDALCVSLESAKSCDNKDKSAVKVSKGGRKKTDRNVFMGACMRSPEKGGMGKGMKECSDKFKQMSPDEKKRYMSNGENK